MTVKRRNLSDSQWAGLILDMKRHPEADWSSPLVSVCEIWHLYSHCVWGWVYATCVSEHVCVSGIIKHTTALSGLAPPPTSSDAMIVPLIVDHCILKTIQWVTQSNVGMWERLCAWKPWWWCVCKESRSVSYSPALWRRPWLPAVCSLTRRDRETLLVTCLQETKALESINTWKICECSLSAFLSLFLSYHFL